MSQKKQLISQRPHTTWNLISVHKKITPKCPKHNSQEGKSVQYRLKYYVAELPPSEERQSETETQWVWLEFGKKQCGLQLTDFDHKR